MNIIETVQKLKKVVSAVPGMESFINTVAKQLNTNGPQPVPIEKVIPTIQQWKHELMSEYHVLKDFKLQVALQLGGGPVQAHNEVTNVELLEGIQRMQAGVEGDAAPPTGPSESDNIVKYLHQVFKTTNNGDLVTRINETVKMTEQMRSLMLMMN